MNLGLFNGSSRIAGKVILDLHEEELAVPVAVSQANQIAHETGYRYHYMMVFESTPIEGASTTADVLKLIEAL